MTTSKFTLDGTTRENWLATLDLAIREVFEIMLSSRLERPDGAVAPDLEFTAMVGLAGELCGVFSFRCGSEAAALIGSKMLGIEPKDVGEQSWDAIGEVCNMVAGNFKNKITGLSERCVLSAPTVVTGSDYRVHPLACDCLQVSFLFEEMPVEASLEIRS
jgi:chemotaxis protein CheX